MAAKKAKKASKRAAPARAASAHVGNVTTLVNGTVQGEIVPGDGSIQSAVETLARNAGLMAFNVRVNGVTITHPEALAPLKGAKTLEIYAKDTRGSL